MSDSRAFTYMHLANLDLIEQMHAQFLDDPESIDPTWRYFFEGIEFAQYTKAPKEYAADLRIFNLIDAYRRDGHLEAECNPIATHTPPPAHELKLESLGFKASELKTLFPTCGLLPEETAPLEKIVATLREIYCGTTGIEYMGRHPPELETWVQSQIEPNHFRPNFSIEEKKLILQSLNRAELFEIFLHTKYVGQKRFSLEGGETLIPILGEIIEVGTQVGAEEFVIGMAHRGRLNVLTNIMQKSFSMVFGEFEDFVDPNQVDIAGDVKYHKGYSSNITTRSGKKVHISLSANPSHLESVDPVVEGKVRAKQVFLQDEKQKKVIPILIHGDSSVAGQGVVYETAQMSGIPGYGNGGTLHIVINNQIGFTTLPHEYRSSRYSTDIAHAFGFPVFHVNGEDPEGCVFATQLALKIREMFQCDVFIELNCYRKYGHNESDEPAFTQPLEYQLIRKKKSIREIYRDTLVQQGVLEGEMALSLEKEFKESLHYEMEDLKIKKEVIPEEAFGGVWEDFHKATKSQLLHPIKTAVSADELQNVANMICTVPEGFEIHNKLKRLVEQRRQMAQGEIPIDWAMGEHLAMGTLLAEGRHVRLSGQDSQRGTFTQRHSVWVDQVSGKRYFPLSHFKGEFNVYNSLLSEYGVLGFEFGYSLAYPTALVIWEAQFGDFANGAQVIFDQYLCCCEQKWRRYSGLVVLLPHGYEGQGAEHSSGRVERFLQLAGESNLQIVTPSTPAQYFHLLRRQTLRDIRIPLIIFTPKGLLRHPKCISQLEEFTNGTFKEILDDPEGTSDAKRLLLCTGRIYYDLIAERAKLKRDDVAIVRIEQLYPLHQDKLVQILEKYRNVREYYWVQEEPRNMGAFGYMYPILHEHLPKKSPIQYVGRARSASTAAGLHSLHMKQHHQLMKLAFE